MSGTRLRASSAAERRPGARARDDDLARVRWGDEYASGPWHLRAFASSPAMLCGSRVPALGPMTTRIESHDGPSAPPGERCRECGRLAAALLRLRGHRELGR